MPRLAASLAAAGILLAPGRAEAQCSTGNSCSVTVAMPVTEVLRLTLSTASTDLGTPTLADFNAGFLDAAGPTATVRANRPWRVTVAGTGSVFSYSGAMADPAKPLSDLLWSSAPSGYANSFATPGTLAAGGPGLVNAPIFFRTQWHFLTDVPGSYQATVSFTLSAP